MRIRWLKLLLVQSSFGRTLYNLARADPWEFECVWGKNNKGYDKPTYHHFGAGNVNQQAAVGFIMFGTVVDCQLEESFTLPTRGSHILYSRRIVIRPLTMEIQRTLNTLAEIWDVAEIGLNVRNGGITFSTIPSKNPYRECLYGNICRY